MTLINHANTSGDDSGLEARLLLLALAYYNGGSYNTIVEAGTYNGNTTRYLFEHLPMGHTTIYTCDIRQPALPLPPEIRFHPGDYSEMLEKFNIRDITLAYIDSGPNTTQALRLRHFKDTLPRLAPNGIIVIDDLNRASDWMGAAELRDRCHVVLSLARGVGIYYNG